MPKHPNISEETAAMQRQEAMETRPQDRYARRGKFTGCPECGSDFGMHSALREEMAEFMPGAIKRFAPWYKDSGNDLVLYYPCWRCNFGGDRPVPDGFEPISIADVLYWSCSAMVDLLDSALKPDYAALAREEPVPGVGGQPRQRGNGGIRW